LDSTGRVLAAGGGSRLSSQPVPHKFNRRVIVGFDGHLSMTVNIQLLQRWTHSGHIALLCTAIQKLRPTCLS
jgi:hypothetical protein